MQLLFTKVIFKVKGQKKIFLNSLGIKKKNKINFKFKNKKFINEKELRVNFRDQKNMFAM